MSYVWNFGDGASITSTDQAVVSHTYTTKGRYTATLTVTDAAGQADQAQTTINLKNLRR